MTINYIAICVTVRFLATNAFLLILIGIRQSVTMLLAAGVKTLSPRFRKTFLRSSDAGFVKKVQKHFCLLIFLCTSLTITHVKNLFRSIGHRLPSEINCRRTALQLSEDELKRIRNAVYDKQIFLIADKNTLSGMQYLNILVRSLESPLVSYV